MYDRSSSGCTVYIGNLDEKVTDRVLYDILIQVGQVVDLHMPRDKETGRPKGFAFAEYETEEIADYAVKLFSGLVTLFNRTLRFAISGQDRAYPNGSFPSTPTSNSTYTSRSNPDQLNNEGQQHSVRLSATCAFSDYPQSHLHQVSPCVNTQSNGSGSHYGGNNYDYSRSVYGAASDRYSQLRSRRNDTNNGISYL